MELKTGARLKSQCCDTEVVVTRAGSAELDLRCGGHPLVAQDSAEAMLEVLAGYDGGTLLGKRYTTGGDAPTELLVSKGGAGSLSLGEQILETKDAKPLPASD